MTKHYSNETAHAVLLNPHEKNSDYEDRNEVVLLETLPATHCPTLPQLGAFDDEDVSDIIRKLRELHEDD